MFWYVTVKSGISPTFNGLGNIPTDTIFIIFGFDEEMIGITVIGGNGVLETAGNGVNFPIGGKSLTFTIPSGLAICTGTDSSGYLISSDNVVFCCTVVLLILL